MEEHPHRRRLCGSGENDNLIVQKLEANPNAYGIFGFSFLEENEGKIKGAKIEGVAPSFETVSDASYKVARPLFHLRQEAACRHRARHG